MLLYILKVYDIWREAEQNIFGKMGSSDMVDTDVFALFPGNWLTDKVQIKLVT